MPPSVGCVYLGYLFVALLQHCDRWSSVVCSVLLFPLCVTLSGLPVTTVFLDAGRKLLCQDVTQADWMLCVCAFVLNSSAHFLAERRVVLLSSTHIHSVLLFSLRTLLKAFEWVSVRASVFIGNLAVLAPSLTNQSQTFKTFPQWF